MHGELIVSQLFWFLYFGSFTLDNVSGINACNFFYYGQLTITLHPFLKSMKSIFLGQLTFCTSHSRKPEKWWESEAKTFSKLKWNHQLLPSVIPKWTCVTLSQMRFLTLFHSDRSVGKYIEKKTAPSSYGFYICWITMSLSGPNGEEWDRMRIFQTRTVMYHVNN